MTAQQLPDSRPRRTPLIEALRAAAVLIITWHHFARYGPLSTWAAPVAGSVLEWFHRYGRVAPIFFVISGYVLDLSLSQRSWNIRSEARFAVQRYLRLGLPYLATIALALAASAYARGWLPLEVVGAPPTIQQILAHVLLLQDILGYESLSTGLWFVCISFQLSMVYVAMLWLRDCTKAAAEPVVGMAGSGAESPPWRSPALSRRSPGAEFLGWGLAAASLFYFNLNEAWDVWFLYFFGHFYLGVVVHQALSQPRKQWLFWLYVLMFVASMVFFWRVPANHALLSSREERLLASLITGGILFAGGRLGFMSVWPRSRVINYLGRTSYSLFLVHFPVLMVVATFWTRHDWHSPWQAMVGLTVAFILSLVVSDLFYRAIEKPSDRLSRRFS
ncbi:MAG: acyltransferase [Planctomycetes bacterium]|nr:acyltransferase [Planctomycetota bacterium]